ncbi:hypothetical protein CEXT_186551 [Caerostris extrusa]|uniref:Uncharacterized protein n=1 Tax=Caerostris extrusa TaxID=172846 RepID=A0AAV4VEC5_CAEEX|nr:hypothetical protein CEXT_186551 [Caerostris extrusa]
MALKSRRFNSASEGMDSVRNWLQPQPNSFYKRSIHRLVQQRDKCMCNFVSTALQLVRVHNLGIENSLPPTPR